MSYLRADRILPRELVEAIQQYVDGTSIYIPRKEKHVWGSGTKSKSFFRERNGDIYDAYLKGSSVKELSLRFSLSEKSIQRILRDRKLADAGESDAE